MIRGRSTAALLGALAVLGVSPSLTYAAENRPLVGIAEQKTSMYYDDRYLSLGVRDVRIIVPWDAAAGGWQAERVIASLDEATRAGKRVLVGFEKSGVRSKYLPTVKEYMMSFRWIRQRWPHVTSFATWNEPNHHGQPPRKNPARVAAYWVQMRAECPKCTLLAAEILDIANLAEWTRGFLEAPGGRRPRIWGLHNYVDVNRYEVYRTREAVKLLARRKIWLTETGGVVRRRNRSGVKLGGGEAHAVKANRHLLYRIPKLFNSIERIYFYHWDSSTPTDSWDSAFITWDGRERPSLQLLRDYLAGR